MKVLGAPQRVSSIHQPAVMWQVPPVVPHWVVLEHFRPEIVQVPDAGGSMSSIDIMPPGKTSFVVISRSLCECHMYA